MGKLRFILGPSGSGKTTRIYEELLRRAAENPHTNFLIVVPDQYTMQTQWDVSNIKIDGVSKGGIMNIDVLSFGRLTHRIMQEVGWEELPVLDDTGKSLVLARIAGRISKELPLLGSRLHRQGYIHEVKSVISEFMQYGIGPEKIDSLIEAASDKGALSSKLKDLQTIYKSFNEYLEGNYITREEKMDVLRELLPSSAILPGSVVVFDGFTGFTPIQANVIEDIMSLAEETIVSLSLGADTNLQEALDPQNLFYLSGKTYKDLCKRAKERDVEILQEQYCNLSTRTQVIEHIEKNLFRPNSKVYKGETLNGIHMAQMSTIPEEVHQVGLQICEYLRVHPDIQYRNIVIVTGDQEMYAPYITREFGKLGIPFFLDKTSGIRLNPLVEAIRSVLGIYTDNFSIDSVVRYLRSGLSGFEPSEVDDIDLYIRQRGIRGQKKWREVFALKSASMDSNDEEPLKRLNATREKLIGQLDILAIKSKDTVSNYVNNLYEFLLAIKASEQLEQYAEDFEQEGDLIREKEYSQIYQKVMELLEQVINLMGEDKISIREFYEILDAGFGEIRVGTIPQTVDKVMVGDIERSRVPSICAMFFLGVNDGNIPKNSDKGGILSDIDRENLHELNFELAPTPREAMYTQRLYLYLNMTKPIYDLYISWAGIDPSGKSLRHSYLCDVIKRMFPGIKVERPEERIASEQITTSMQGVRYLSDGLRQLVENGNTNGSELFDIYEAYNEGDSALRGQMEKAAFISYSPEKLDEKLAQKLYCRSLDDPEEDAGQAVLRSSVSRLESFGSCPYSYFMNYGLKLHENTDFAVSRLDNGNIYHNVLQSFSNKLKSDKLSWREFTESYARENIHEITRSVTSLYNQAVYDYSERSSHLVKRLERALLCTVMTIQYQVAKGGFEPFKVEDKFFEEYEMKNSESGQKRKMILEGRIDRIDKASGENGDMIRVVDYKSSSKNLDLAKIYDGQQLQLALYTGSAAKKQNAKPAAMLYYHVDDPVLDAKDNEDIEELKLRRVNELKMNGYVDSSDECIYMCDKYIAENGGSSDVVKVGYKKDGSLSATSSVLDSDEMQTVIDYARKKAVDRGGEILDGNIAASPIDDGSACKYCSFKSSCNFDSKIPGYKKRTPEKVDKDEVIDLMREKLSGN